MWYGWSFELLIFNPSLLCLTSNIKIVKGYIRKGKILQGMQDAGKAMTAYEKALEIDSNNAGKFKF